MEAIQGRKQSAQERTASQSTLPIHKAIDPGRTRACNPRLRRPMPYPLGHGATSFHISIRNRPCFGVSALGLPRKGHIECRYPHAPGWPPKLQLQPYALIWGDLNDSKFPRVMLPKAGRASSMGPSLRGVGKSPRGNASKHFQSTFRHQEHCPLG